MSFFKPQGQFYQSLIVEFIWKGSYKPQKLSGEGESKMKR